MYDEMQHAIDSLLPGTATGAQANRRSALKAALGVGFAAAVLPVCAQTVIKTDDAGLEVGDALEWKHDGTKGLAAVLVQYPDTLGVIHDYAELAAEVHEAGALLIVSADLLALTPESVAALANLGLVKRDAWAVLPEATSFAAKMNLLKQWTETVKRVADGVGALLTRAASEKKLDAVSR